MSALDDLIESDIQDGAYVELADMAKAELARLREAEELVELLKSFVVPGFAFGQEHKAVKLMWMPNVQKWGVGADDGSPTLYSGPSLHDALQALRGEQ